jgi:hypothetical protein
MTRIGDVDLPEAVCREGITLALDQGLDVTGLHALQRDLLGPPRLPALVRPGH